MSVPRAFFMLVLLTIASNGFSQNLSSRNLEVLSQLEGVESVLGPLLTELKAIIEKAPSEDQNGQTSNDIPERVLTIVRELILVEQEMSGMMGNIARLKENLVSTGISDEQLEEFSKQLSTLSERILGESSVLRDFLDGLEDDKNKIRTGSSKEITTEAF